MRSLSFDRAAGYYDQTRGLPDEIADQIAASAASRLPTSARVLEIGIGTGRISIPLMRCGLRVSGVDLSILMMRRLLEKMPEKANPPGLILADATRLPLCPACFDAVFAVHVFHLVAGWQQAVSEVRRVIHPGGALLLGNSHRDPQSPQAEIRQQWARIIHDRAGKDQRPGVLDSDELEAHLRALGAQITSWEAAQWETLTSLAETIQQMEAAVHSNTWHLSAEALHACAASLRIWARERYGDLEQPVKTAMRFTWRAAQWRA